MSSSILVEIITPTSLPGKKSTILTTFQSIFHISSKAAVPGVIDPGLSFQSFPNITSNEDQCGILLCWKDMQHHDGLAAQPGFAEGAKLFGSDILPNVVPEGLGICYVMTKQTEVALKGKEQGLEAVEVLEVSVGGDEGVEQCEKGVAKVFDGGATLPEGFLGYFAGPKLGEEGIYVVVTKWSSKSAVEDKRWVKESEESLLGALGAEAKVSKRLQMYI